MQNLQSDRALINQTKCKSESTGDKKNMKFSCKLFRLRGSLKTHKNMKSFEFFMKRANLHNAERTC